MCEQVLIRKYMEQKFFSKIKIAEPEIKSYFVSHQAEYQQPERVVIRQILFADEARARKLRNQLNRDNFVAMVREHSIAPEKDTGGKLGPFARGQMPDVFNVAFMMRQGELSPVLKSTYGFHVLLLERKIPQTNDSLDMVRPQIIRQLTTTRQEEAYRSAVEQAMGLMAISATKSLC